MPRAIHMPCCQTLHAKLDRCSPCCWLRQPWLDSSHRIISHSYEVQQCGCCPFTPSQQPTHDLASPSNPTAQPTGPGKAAPPCAHHSRGSARYALQLAHQAHQHTAAAPPGEALPCAAHTATHHGCTSIVCVCSLHVVSSRNAYVAVQARYWCSTDV